MLNRGINIVGMDPSSVSQKISREHPYISCQVFRMIDLLRRSIINPSAQILI